MRPMSYDDISFGSLACICAPGQVAFAWNMLAVGHNAANEAMPCRWKA